MKAVISPKKHHAVIFDLDGVITKTAKIHARTWKLLFDTFLKDWAKEKGSSFTPFDEEKDYLSYVDGKPRSEGIASFLASRHIEIPFGSQGDDKEQKTVCGLGNKKNALFLEELKKKGIALYSSTIELIKNLRGCGIKTALISSSKNCTDIIKKAGIADLFDAKIDGIDSQNLNLKGKPEPDVFLKAADQLGVDPCYAVVVEDAISGVKAGKEGRFAEVIGVDRSCQSDALLENGADVVVQDLSEVIIEEDGEEAPNALDKFKELSPLLKGKKIVLFLDYDGTLTPITSHPALANLDNMMRDLIKELCTRYTVAIISGRDLNDVESRVQIEGIFYAGSHGFEIEGPERKKFESEEAKEKIPQLELAEHDLKEGLSRIKGAWVERKKYSVAIHYRQAAQEKEEEIAAIVKNVQKKYPHDLRLSKGKKIFDIQPAILWHKGKALLWLLKLFELDKENVLPIYLGDDVTDEDAFKEILDYGIGIAVQETPHRTAAKYTLKNPEEVREFLTLLKRNQRDA